MAARYQLSALSIRDTCLFLKGKQNFFAKRKEVRDKEFIHRNWIASSQLDAAAFSKYQKNEGTLISVLFFIASPTPDIEIWALTRPPPGSPVGAPDYFLKPDFVGVRGNITFLDSAIRPLRLAAYRKQAFHLLSDYHELNLRF